MPKYKYGVFRKGSNKPATKTETKEQAELLVKYNFIECEVRPLWVRKTNKSLSSL